MGLRLGVGDCGARPWMCSWFPLSFRCMHASYLCSGSCFHGICCGLRGYCAGSRWSFSLCHFVVPQLLECTVSLMHMCSANNSAPYITRTQVSYSTNHTNHTFIHRINSFRALLNHSRFPLKHTTLSPIPIRLNPSLINTPIPLTTSSSPLHGNSITTRLACTPSPLSNNPCTTHRCIHRTLSIPNDTPSSSRNAITTVSKYMSKTACRTAVSGSRFAGYG
jgi:hypothetical protein